eukprot:scpid76587/ scgid24449/ 
MLHLLASRGARRELTCSGSPGCAPLRLVQVTYSYSSSSRRGCGYASLANRHPQRHILRHQPTRLRHDALLLSRDSGLLHTCRVHQRLASHSTIRAMPVAAKTQSERRTPELESAEDVLAAIGNKSYTHITTTTTTTTSSSKVPETSADSPFAAARPRHRPTQIPSEGQRDTRGRTPAPPSSSPAAAAIAATSRRLSDEAQVLMEALEQPGVRVEETLEFVMRLESVSSADRQHMLERCFANLTRNFHLRSLGRVASQDDLLMHTQLETIESFQQYVVRVLNYIGQQRADAVGISDVVYMLKLVSFASSYRVSAKMGAALISTRHVLLHHIPECVCVTSMLALLRCFKVMPSIISLGPVVELIVMVTRKVGEAMSERRDTPTLRDVLRLSSSCQLLTHLRIRDDVFMEATSKYMLRTVANWPQSPYSPSFCQRILFMFSFFRYPVPELCSALHEYLSFDLHMERDSTLSQMDLASRFIRLNWAFVAQGVSPPQSMVNTMIGVLQHPYFQNMVPHVRLLEQLVHFVGRQHALSVVHRLENVNRFRTEGPLEAFPISLFHRHYHGVMTNVHVPYGPLAVAALICTGDSTIAPWPMCLHPSFMRPELAATLPGVPVACIMLDADQWIDSPAATTPRSTTNTTTATGDREDGGGEDVGNGRVTSASGGCGASAAVAGDGGAQRTWNG